MNQILTQIGSSVRLFAEDEEGAQIIEYALIIAAISLTLIVALQALNGTSFTQWIGKVGTCLTTGVCT